MPSNEARCWTLLVCGNCGEHDTVDQADENDAHCSACDEWMNTETVEVVAVDVLRRVSASLPNDHPAQAVIVASGALGAALPEEDQRG